MNWSTAQSIYLRQRAPPLIACGICEVDRLRLAVHMKLHVCTVANTLPKIRVLAATWAAKSICLSSATGHIIDGENTCSLGACTLAAATHSVVLYKTHVLGGDKGAMEGGNGEDAVEYLHVC